jgi:hypothetical protein
MLSPRKTAPFLNKTFVYVVLRKRANTGFFDGGDHMRRFILLGSAFTFALLIASTAYGSGPGNHRVSPCASLSGVGEVGEFGKARSDDGGATSSGGMRGSGETDIGGFSPDDMAKRKGDSGDGGGPGFKRPKTTAKSDDGGGSHVSG